MTKMDVMTFCILVASLHEVKHNLASWPAARNGISGKFLAEVI